ncbi:MAG TPA: glycosyltransferase [Geminicoccus sp.]|uniref:glycosyltransferase n=1 Tax=Geminicoccus sp. TaxID=2024832 RepID=UPI002E37DBE8|nr:glycosyltransferase [Geminicoccus sp.]HEX2528358.1 glycosyltransferase [Geminicoccus sp.]
MAEPLRLGLFAAFDPSWGGGESYLLNLLDAIGRRPELKVVLFHGHDASSERVERWRGLGSETVALDQLTRHRPAWWGRKLGEYLDFPRVDGLDRVLAGRVDVTFLRPLPCRAPVVPNVHWIPDFQERHLPDMFTAADQRTRAYEHARFLERSALTIVQTEEAAVELAGWFPMHADRARVLPFAVTVPRNVMSTDPLAVIQRYELPERFVYLPAQLWRHKNHALVVEALAMVPDLTIVSTGHLVDYRAPDHVVALRARIQALGLGQRFRLLGPVPLEVVFALHRRAMALLNPSRFEGWSTTVEEAKALGRPLLLSDIRTHRAQAEPGRASWFGVDDMAGLARALEQVRDHGRPGPDLMNEAQALDAYALARARFGRDFVRIIEAAAAG